MSMVGQVTINGIQYTERFQVFPTDLTVTASGVVYLNQQLNLTGLAPFRLKALTRQTLISGAPSICPFKFKLGNTEGGIWYSGAGIGGTNDRVNDVLIFGNGQFPFPVVPSIIYDASASIMFEVQDLGGATSYPYTISFGFIGTYLFKVNGQ